MLSAKKEANVLWLKRDERAKRFQLVQVGKRHDPLVPLHPIVSKNLAALAEISEYALRSNDKYTTVFELS